MNNYWIQGGPYLEASFFLECNFENKVEIAKSVLEKISEVNPKIEIISSEEKVDEFIASKEEIDEIILQLIDGHLYDETNDNTATIHGISFPIYVNFSRKRKGTLEFSCSSKDKLIMINFVFCGDEYDNLELDQTGITKEEFPELKDFFINLFYVFEFPIGTLGYEMYVRYLFDSTKEWPDELSYDLSILSESEILGKHLFDFDYIIINKNFRMLSNPLPQNVYEINNGFIIHKLVE